MPKNQSLFGIVVAMTVTGVAVALAAGFSATQNGSIQPQGQDLLALAKEEIQTIPEVGKEVTSTLVKSTESILEETGEEVDEIIEESDSVSELVQESKELVSETLPDIPDVVKQADGKLLELVSIPMGTDMPGCDKTRVCYLPSDAVLSAGGEVIWTNHDSVAHTITSGNPTEGLDGLFDSGLIEPGETYSLEFEIPYNYEYFCLVHPWMQGSIIVQ
ncbi:MAG: plastocyanin/azurin family copper-binding protein [Nitrosopumilaceae archaeon]|jgi:plastocyanin/gas vesicle protein